MFRTIKKTLKSFGPGFIIAAVVLGPGSITVASRIGAEYGYAFLWVIVVAAVSMVIYTSMGVRFGIVSDKSILQSIADNYGKWFAVLIGVSSFLSATSFQFGNNLGIAIGMNGITGISERVWPLVFTPLAMVLIFSAKNLYKIIEKLMMVMVMVMILAFFLNLFLTKPAIGPMARGFIPHALRKQNLDVVAALVSTTFALVGAIYQSYLVQNKGWKIPNMKGGQRDAYMGIFLLALISALIIMTSAAALHPYGIQVNSAADMALQLKALLGNYASIVFSLGLCAAAFSSLMVNAVMGAGLLADGLGLGRSMNDKMPRIFTAAIMLIGMLIAIFFRGDVVYALILAQASSIFAVPLIAIGMYLILNNKKVMGNYTNTIGQNVLAVFGFLLVSMMVYFMFAKLIGFIGSL